MPSNFPSNVYTAETLAQILAATAPLLNLLGALMVGLIIGVQRSLRNHSTHSANELPLIGIRSYGMMGMAGGFWGYLAQLWNAPLLGLGVAGLVVAVLLFQDEEKQDATSLLAAIITVALGALAGIGRMELAAAGAVLLALLLSLKPTLHGWLRHITQGDWLAALKLGLISLVILPLLPNIELGPYGFFNPYKIWFFVVLIAALSFLGYAAVKLQGARRGLLLTGFFGGLASSTATTISFARLLRDNPALTYSSAAGVLMACNVMLLRLAFLLYLVAPALLPQFLAPLLVGAMVGFAVAFAYAGLGKFADAVENLDNPFALGMAVKMALFIALIGLLSHLAQDKFGTGGIMLLAAFAGLADVDAFTLSLGHLPAASAIPALLVLILSNSLVKAVLLGLLGNLRAALLVALGFALSLLSAVVMLPIIG